jgi:NAD(P)-dependent dehydrogenase (short-subunit alcohol dehydrogenase family)
MLRHGKGSIINIASMSGVIVNRGLKQVHYNASKAGVIHMSKSMAMEWVDRGVRVNSISPGYTATPMNTRPEMVHQTKAFESQTPMQRMARVDEMVGPAVFLASDASSFCTGSIFWSMVVSAAGDVGSGDEGGASRHGHLSGNRGADRCHRDESALRRVCQMFHQYHSVNAG